MKIDMLVVLETNTDGGVNIATDYAGQAHIYPMDKPVKAASALVGNEKRSVVKGTLTYDVVTALDATQLVANMVRSL